MSAPVNTQHSVNQSFINAFVNAAFLQSKAVVNCSDFSSEIHFNNMMLNKSCMSKLVCPCLLAHSLVIPTVAFNHPKRKRRKKRKRKGNNNSISILQSLVR